jgi:hypothetical protein
LAKLDAGVIWEKSFKLTRLTIKWLRVAQKRFILSKNKRLTLNHGASQWKCHHPSILL